MPDNETLLERVYDAVTTLTAEVRAVMERLVRVEMKSEHAHENFTTLKAELASVQVEQANQKASVAAMETKLSIYGVVAGSIAGLITALLAKYLKL